MNILLSNGCHWWKHFFNYISLVYCIIFSLFIIVIFSLVNKYLCTIKCQENCMQNHAKRIASITKDWKFNF